ncbi:hypothetical protein [Paraburkholderia silviterrae]|uniref:Uncharacterized protein n=1 Tax=Paraburkholderia silviterrae TaxID=2528715 RepID=A0A4R5M1Y7_9BURK|nr:hypothetical protein [Paraburkholderia silviterrae]TDG19145.1 hypothetical protein EYW47_31970 [Paraburkholderia silviterrae]
MVPAVPGVLFSGKFGGEGLLRRDLQICERIDRAMTVAEVDFDDLTVALHIDDLNIQRNRFGILKLVAGPSVPVRGLSAAFSQLEGMEGVSKSVLIGHVQA